MKLLTYVTGTSCAGKTTVAEYLRGRLAGADAVVAPGGWCVPPGALYSDHPLPATAPYHVVDVDEDGAPSGGGDSWLAYRALDLLARHDAGEFETDHLVVCGIAMPFHVLDSREARTADVDVRFLVLDVTKAQLKDRLGLRLPRPKKDRKAREHYVRTNAQLAARLRVQAGALCCAMVASPETTAAARGRLALETAW